MLKFSILIFFFLCFLSIAKFQNVLDITYRNVTECIALCKRDSNICEQWISEIIQLPKSYCDSLVQEPCMRLCKYNTYDTLGTTRCDTYKYNLLRWKKTTDEQIQLALEGCYHEAGCLQTCSTDLMFCNRLRGEKII